MITAAALARRRHLPLRGAAIAFVATLVLGAVGFVTMLGGLGWR